MPAKKKTSARDLGKPPSETSRTARRPRADDASRARDVLLERIESQMQVVLEAVTGLGQQMKSQLSELETRLSDRISVLEQVVRQNSADIQRNSADIQRNSDDIQRNSDDIRSLREEVAQLRHDFERRAELDRVRVLEERLARVEAKLGIAS